MADGRHPSRQPFRVSIRTKLTVALLLACAPMVALVGWFGLTSATHLIRNQAVRNMQEAARLQARLLEELVLRGTADARYLALLEDVALLLSPAGSGSVPTPEQRRHVTAQFTALSKSTGIYSQVWVLDAANRVVAGIGHGPEDARASPSGSRRHEGAGAQLQVADRLPPGQVFITPLHLRREGSRVVDPPTPMMCFAAPIFVGGHRLGAVVLEANVGPLLPRGPYRGGETFLLDTDGWYLAHTDESRAWSGPLDRHTGRRLQQDYGAEATIATRPVPAVLLAQGSLLATHPIMLSRGTPATYMVLCVAIREDEVLAGLRDYQRFFWVVLLVSFVAPMLGGIALGTFFLRPMRQLRRAVHAVAEGDLSADLQVHSRDEFEVLAQDFNTMAQRLQEYQQRERLAAVGQMVATIIHDLKNPLAALAAMTQLATARELSADQRLDIGRRSRAQSDRILGMLQEILDFARSGRTEIVVAPLAFSEVMAGLVEELAPRCAENGVTLTASGASVCVVDADQGRLRRALSNIIVNACEAMQEGGTIAVDTTCDELGVTIRIADTGPGIPEDILPRLFEPFVTHGKAQGTGLGLAIAQAIIDAHGGRISVSNRPEGGAEFRVWLPRGTGATTPKEEAEA